MFKVDAEGPCNSTSALSICSSQIRKSVIDGTGVTEREMAAASCQVKLQLGR